MIERPKAPGFRKPMRCNFTAPNPAAGTCRKCGEAAEPGAKQLCIDCAIEEGSRPITPPDSKKSEESKSS